MARVRCEKCSGVGVQLSTGNAGIVQSTCLTCDGEGYYENGAYELPEPFKIAAFVLTLVTGVLLMMTLGFKAAPFFKWAYATVGDWLLPLVPLTLLTILGLVVLVHRQLTAPARKLAVVKRKINQV